jgi:hypothetical protein
MSWLNEIKWPSDLKREFGDGEVPNLNDRQIVRVTFDLEAIEVFVAINPVPENYLGGNSKSVESFGSIEIIFRLADAELTNFNQTLIKNYIKVTLQLSDKNFKCITPTGETLFAAQFESLTARVG